MSKDQKGFVVYGDIKAVIDKLNDTQVAQLFRGMVNYFLSGEVPEFTGVLEFVFIPIKQQMDRDQGKYEEKCKKNRQSIQSYWDSVRTNTNEYERIRMNTNATNTNTNTNTNKKTNTNTTTTTNTNTKVRGGGDCDDEFNIFKLLGGEGIDKVYEKYPNSGGDLIQEVYEDVKAKRKTIKSPVAYVLGYAKRVGWDDNADHFNGGDLT